MFDNEEKFKKDLINCLNNNLFNGWEDGDKMNKEGKKVDIVNTKYKIAIEIKDQLLPKTSLPSKSSPVVFSSYNPEKFQQILLDDIKDASQKFKNYSDYQTILLWRMNFVGQLKEIKSLITKGYDLYIFDPIQGKVYYGGKKISKYRNLSSLIKEIGLFYIYISNLRYSHPWPNSKAHSYRKLKPKIKKELIKVLELCLNSPSKP
jgi:hypothetical protein